MAPFVVPIHSIINLRFGASPIFLYDILLTLIRTPIAYILVILELISSLETESGVPPNFIKPFVHAENVV